MASCDSDSDYDVTDETSLWLDEEELDNSLPDYGELFGSWACHDFHCESWTSPQSRWIENSRIKRYLPYLDAWDTFRAAHFISRLFHRNLELSVLVPLRGQPSSLLNNYSVVFFAAEELTAKPTTVFLTSAHTEATLQQLRTVGTELGIARTKRSSLRSKISGFFNFIVGRSGRYHL